MKNTIKKLNIITLCSVIALFAIIAVPVSASTITKDRVIEMVNQSRAEYGMIALQENNKLDLAAELKVDDMIVSNYFAHTSPSGISPWHWIGEVDYEYHYAGENLAMNFTVAEKQHKAWMESPTHKKNILNGNYTEIGVAVREGVVSNHKTIIVVQTFGSPFGVVPVSLQEKVNGEQSFSLNVPNIKPVEMTTMQRNSIGATDPLVVLGLMIIMMLIVGLGINITIIRDIIRYHRLGVSEIRM